MEDFLAVAVKVFIINLVPAFMPPTWVVLALARADNPWMDPLTLTLIGAVSSTLGRAVLAFYSSFFRRFFTKDLEKHAEYVRQFFSKKGIALFAGTFLYALSPFPSNLVFIAEGLTGASALPLFSGFFLGRLISYYVLIVLSGNVHAMLSGYFKSESAVTYLFEIVGILAGVSIIFIDWKKLIGGENGKKTERGEKGS